jgi:hypothetical protein
MPSLFSRITKFAKSPQGKKLAKEAQQFVSKPENRKKVADLRSRVAKKR